MSSIPEHARWFLEWLEGQWETPLQAVRRSKEGARFMAFQNGQERQYILYAIDAGPQNAVGIVREVDSGPLRSIE
jgi:hypothetical protein